MWSRKEVKEKGKAVFFKNYWKCVLVAMLIALITGNGFSAGNSFSSGSRRNSFFGSDKEDTEFSEKDEEKEEAFIDGAGNGDTAVTIKNRNEVFDEIKDDVGAEGVLAFVIIIVMVVLIFVLVVIALAIVLDALVINPLELGCKKFFLKNLREPAKVSNIGYAFDHNYKNIVKTLFLRDIYLVLWTFALVIPAIIKSYEYRMIPYLLAENPEMTAEEAFRTSKTMMKGQKWKTFVLDLSFIGWRLLSVFMMGLVGIFFVNPYVASTNAALYEKLRYGQRIDSMEWE